MRTHQRFMFRYPNGYMHERETIASSLDGMRFEERQGDTLTEFIEYMEKYHDMELVDSITIVMEPEAPSRIDLIFRSRFDVIDD